MAAFRCAPDDKSNRICTYVHNPGYIIIFYLSLILFLNFYFFCLPVVNVYLGIYVANAQFGGFLDRIPVYIVIAWTVIAFIH